MCMYTSYKYESVCTLHVNMHVYVQYLYQCVVWVVLPLPPWYTCFSWNPLAIQGEEEGWFPSILLFFCSIQNIDSATCAKLLVGEVYFIYIIFFTSF